VSKKSLIICICVALLLLGAICVGVKKLYSSKPAADGKGEHFSHAELLQAVPSDAALVFCFDNARTGLAMLDDRSQVFHSLLGGNVPFGRFAATVRDSVAFKAHAMAVSVHYSETLVPLMIVKTTHASDTTGFERELLAYAQSCGLQTALKKGEEYGFVLLSPSETLVESSSRHLDGRTSILDDPYFSDLASQLSAREVLFLSHSYMGKLISSLCQKPLYPYSTFLKGAAEWTGFDIRESGQKRLRMTGRSTSGRSPGYYANLLAALPAGESRFARLAPARTMTALALSLPDFDAYVKAYEKWLDASQSLQKFRRSCDTLKAHTGEDPVKWFARSGIREIAKVSWLSSEGKELSLLLMRMSGNAGNGSGSQAFPYEAFPALVFGDAFRSPGKVSRVQDDWLCVGSESALADWESLLEERGSLQTVLDDVSESRMIPAKGVKALAYFSVSDAQPRFSEWFRPLLSDNLQSSLEAVIREPVVLCCGEEGWSLEASRPVDYAERKASAKRGSTPGRKADVEVPAGPFEVTNSGTGKTNLFYQAPNLSLCLKDKDSGKGLWGISFDKPICGAVSCVDYFANGKLQFLFAAGSQLYLIDRLGRFVSGFPVETGKEILLGPAAYDFSGAKGYTALVLHRDNSIGMYDLHGVQPASWKGITCEDTILSLPVLAHADGNRVWVVKTAGGERVYDFWGGEPLKGKAIKNIEY